LLKELVGADLCAGSFGRRFAGGSHAGEGKRNIQKTASLIAGVEQRVDFRPQLVVAAACLF
jgi:hypothetical protein